MSARAGSPRGGANASANGPSYDGGRIYGSPRRNNQPPPQQGAGGVGGYADDPEDFDDPNYDGYARFEAEKQRYERWENSPAAWRRWAPYPEDRLLGRGGGRRARTSGKYGYRALSYSHRPWIPEIMPPYPDEPLQIAERSPSRHYSSVNRSRSRNRPQPVSNGPNSSYGSYRQRQTVTDGSPGRYPQQSPPPGSYQQQQVVTNGSSGSNRQQTNSTSPGRYEQSPPPANYRQPANSWLFPEELPSSKKYAR